MSVASHLDTTPAGYDAKIRALIPHYEELIAEAAAALAFAARPVRSIVDLGIGTGALAQACLRVAPRARVHGIDADAAMPAMIPARLGADANRVRWTHGNFEHTDLPACDAITASFALHHIRSVRDKQRFYRRCFEALQPGGVLVNGDCAPSSTGRAFARDLEVWYAHLAKTFGRAKGKRVYHSWESEDVYVPLADEVRMLARAGFVVEIPWRRSPLAVIVGVKPGR